VGRLAVGYRSTDRQKTNAVDPACDAPFG